MDLSDLTTIEAAGEVRSGNLSSAQLVDELLKRIESTDEGLQAWTLVDAEGARAAARAADSLRQRDRAARPLLGVPFGVKDVIDARGLPTAAGFAPFAGRVPTRDADAVARLRQAGAIVLGKTVTTQFAHADPPVTTNPWRADRSPGGSSSGSAAAVSAGQVPFALGTQTGGSVIRPAYFCGVVGFKPTRDLLSRRGVIPLAWSLDHVGVIARTALDVATVLQGVTGRPALPPAAAAPRLGLLSQALELADPAVAEAARTGADRLREAGAAVDEVAFPWSWELATAAHHVIMQSEATAAHRDLLARHREAYQPVLLAYLEVGAAIPAVAYLHARRLQRRLGEDMAKLARRFDALLLPPSAAQAPERGSTGESALQAPFSLAGLPAITLPVGVSEERLPHGMQLVGSRNQDEALLSVAAWCQSVMPAAPRPPVAATEAAR